MLKNPKQHIQGIFQERTQGKRNAITLANALQKDIRTGFNGEHKFIFELLQNADDAVNHDQVQNNILFFLKDDLLIVSHAGKHFTEEDVEKICDYAQQQYKDKSADESKIGYKGVGFKAVFSIADCAYIISAGYSFKFDRFDSCWQEQFGNNPVPWPVTPIWCEQQDLPQPIPVLIKKLVNRVNFIFKLQNPEDINQDLEFLSKNSRVLLFLKHITEIKIVINKQAINLSKIKEDSGLICLKKDTQPTSYWIIREFRLKIPEKI